MALDVVHWGGRWGAAPAIVATSASNGMGFNPHQIWAWRRAEMNALAESPFLCRNGARAIMAFIRTLPLRAKGPERLCSIAASLLEPLRSKLEALPQPARVGLVVGLAERFADGSEAHLRRGRGELEAAMIAPLEARGLHVVLTLVPRGHAAFARAVIEANAALAAREIDAAIVGGVDTYYDPDVVEDLLRSKRLFDGENLDSFIPGEGGALCLVAMSATASRCKWPVLARIESAASNEEVGHMGNDIPCLGLGLSRSLRAIADRVEAEHRKIDYWLGDLTNQNYRTQEWMLAFPRASAGVSGPDSTTQFLPVFLGDLGAATMPTAAVLAIESFLRGDPKADNCVVFASSFGEHRGAVLLARESATPLTTGGGSVSPKSGAGPSVAPRAPAAPPPRRSSEGELPAVSPTAALPAESGAKLGLMTYASACAWTAVFPERVVEGWAKYGLAGAAVRAEHEAWARHFKQYPDELEEFDLQVASFTRHWMTRK
ncbi:MAG: hypothetical protein ABSE49_00015 [Polyangiaceae bacterium]